MNEKQERYNESVRLLKVLRLSRETFLEMQSLINSMKVTTSSLWNALNGFKEAICWLLESPTTISALFLSNSNPYAEEVQKHRNELKMHRENGAIPYYSKQRILGNIKQCLSLLDKEIFEQEIIAKTNKSRSICNII